jgi:outer membrane protein
MMKMNKWSVLALFAALLIFTPVAANAEKIGFVDVREVLAKSEAGKKAQAEFKKTVDKRAGLIRQKEAELKKQKEAFDKERPGLSEIAAKEKEMQLQRKYREFQRIVNDANEEMRRKDQELSRRLIPEIYKVVNALGVREGYTLILDVNNPVVIYFAGGNNLTALVISEFNKVSIKTPEKKKPARKGRKK